MGTAGQEWYSWAQFRRRWLGTRGFVKLQYFLENLKGIQERREENNKSVEGEIQTFSWGKNCNREEAFSERVKIHTQNPKSLKICSSNNETKKNTARIKKK